MVHLGNEEKECGTASSDFVIQSNCLQAGAESELTKEQTLRKTLQLFAPLTS